MPMYPLGQFLKAEHVIVYFLRIFYDIVYRKPRHTVAFRLIKVRLQRLTDLDSTF